MKLLKLYLFTVVFLLGSISALAITCADLDSDARIKAFINDSNASIPLLRDNSSAILEMSPCEGKLCRREMRNERARIKEKIYSVKTGARRRMFFVKGPNAPQCLIDRGERQFWCSRCSWTTNEQCRSYKVSQNSTVIRGTNIDREDLQRILDKNHRSTCSELPKQPKYLKIVTRKAGGDSPYDRIVSFYNRRDNYAVTINFFSGKTLRKVYRFFPKYHVKIDGQWVATVVRVRTTQGKESAYLFETLLNVARDSNNRYMLYVDLKKDPRLKSGKYGFLFNTN